MKTPIVIDGVTYPHIYVLSLKRSFSVLDGDNAGRVMTGDMVRDIIGTYYNYSLEIDSDESDPDEYDRLYEVLSAPVDSHTITVPYGQGTLTYKAYATNGEDNLVKCYEELNGWNGLSVNFIAMSPKRRAK